MKGHCGLKGWKARHFEYEAAKILISVCTKAEDSSG